MKENKIATRRWRRLRRGMSTALASALVMLLSAGCGAAGESYDTAMPEVAYNTSASGGASMAAEEASYDYGYDSYDGGVYEAETGTSSNLSPEVKDSTAAQSDRKLIRTVNMDVETKEQDYDMFLSTLQEEVQSSGGYIENMDSYNGSSYGGYRSARSANLTLRIPKERLDAFLGMVSEIANVVRRSDSVDDVTLKYVDLASHKNALQTEQQRLIELLEKAESIEDIITIESRLSTVRYQLESMESQLRTMDNQVDYSTVYLYVSEVKELTPVVERTVWERISYGFVDSLDDIGDGAVNIFVWVLVNLPYLVLWTAFFAVVIFFIKRHWKKGEPKIKAEKKGKKNSEKEKLENLENQKESKD